MDRAFLDANVLFSAAYRADSGLLRIFALPGVAIVSSGYAVEEARRNLEPGAQIARLDGLLSGVEVSRSEAPVDIVPAHIVLPEDDRPILAAAISARCTHLLSGDARAFGPYFEKRIAGVLIQKPAAFLVPRQTCDGSRPSFRELSTR